MAHKLPEIRYKQIGQNLNVIIGDEPTTFKGDKVTLGPIKEKLNAYIAKKSPTLFKEITEAIKPKTIAVAKEKELAEAKQIAEKKLTKKKIKEVKEETKVEEKSEKKAVIARRTILQSLISNNILVANGADYMLAGYESVKMPELLVERFIDFIQLKRDTQPLINFWMWCLLNPNKVARYKLFAYLSKHRLIITPSGYFVTYRMVKVKDDSAKTGIYVDAHTGKFHHIIGQVSKMPRTDCDEDGAKDCSRGLHTGSPDFIGIKLGDGYSKGEIKTKAQGGGHGTGYGASNETVMQKFDNTFGNQAVICLVNPMHVVSIPNSDTRKLRSCELYIAKTTTPEEVLSHLSEADYLVFDNEYAQIEAEEIKKMLKTAKLEDYTDGSVEALKGKKDSPSKTKLKALEAKLSTLNGKVLQDKVADDVTEDEMMRVIQSRVKQASAFYEKPLIDRLSTEGKKAVSNVLNLAGKIVKDVFKSSDATPDTKERATKLKKVLKETKEVYDKSVAKDEKGKKKVVTEKEVPTPPTKAPKKLIAKIADKPAEIPKKDIKPKKAKDDSKLKEFVNSEWERIKRAKKSSPKNFYVLKSSNGFSLVESKGSVPITPNMEGNLQSLHDVLNK